MVSGVFSTDLVVFIFKMTMGNQMILHVESRLPLSSLFSTEQEAEDPELDRAYYFCSGSHAQGVKTLKQTAAS